jgi:hypothetical protein
MALTKITSDVISTGAIESGHIASGAISSGHLTGITTDNVSEGSSNTYFTNARARGSVSVTGSGLSYDSSTGVIQIGSIANSTLTNSSLTVNSNSVSLGGSVTLDTDDIGEGSSNLYFTNARAQGAISGGTGVTVSGGAISIGQDVATSSTPTFGNITTTGYIAGPATFTIDPAAVGDNTGTLVIAGNLQVDGTTTTINSTTMTVDDLNITLASGAANASAANGAGITVDGASATITYDGTNDEWDFNKDINVTGTITASGNITGTLATAAQPNITSVGTLTGLTTSGDINFGDNDKAIFGTGNDLQLYHSGGHSYIDNNKGALFIRNNVDDDDNNNIIIQAKSGEYSIICDDDGAVTLYHDNSPKLATTSTGIDVTGVITSDGLTLQTSENTVSWASGNGVIEAPSNLYLRSTGSGTIYLQDNIDVTGTATMDGLTVDGTSDLNGNVTIGTSLTTLLSGNDIDFQRAGDSYLSQTGGGSLFIRTNDGSSNKVRLNVSPIGDISFYEDTGSTAKFFWDASAERLGIGRTDPTQLLEVHKAAGGDQTVAKFSAHNYEDTGKTFIEIGTEYGDGSSRIGSFNDTGNKSVLVFDTHSASSGQFTERMRIDSSGNVGIGTSNPSGNKSITIQAGTNSSSSLRLKNDAQDWDVNCQTNDTFAIYNQTNSTQPFSILPNGNVGIGENSPDTTLHLKSSGATSIAIESTTNAQNLDLLFYNNAGSTQGYIRYAEGTGDFHFVPQNGGGASLKLDWTGFMAYGDGPSGDPPPNTASFRMNNSSTTGGPSTGGSTGGNTYYPVVIGGGTHLAGRAFGIGLDPEGYGYRNKVGIVVEGDGAGYSKGDLHFLFNNSSDGQNAQISDAKFTFLREGFLGIGTRSPQRTVHVIGPDGSSGMSEGNSRSALFLDNAGATYVNIASGNTSNGAIFFSDPNANNQGAVRYEHLTDSMAFIRGGTETLRLSGQTNVAYTADGLFSSNARAHSFQCTTGGSFHLGYRDSGSGLYQGAMGLQYDSVDGLNNTSYRDALVLKETSNGGQEHFRVRGDGNVTNTNNSYGQISDERLKTNIVDASSQWDDIKAVRVRKFKFGTAPEGHDFLQIGVVSQELEASGMGGLIDESDPDDAQLAFNPELVGQQVKTVKYSVLYMKAIKALQEAMDRIEQLETRVTELEE